VLNFEMSPDFHAKQSPKRPPVAGSKANDLVVSARARAFRERRVRRTLAIAAALVAPVLALNAHWGAGRDGAAPSEVPVASSAALPHIVTRRAPSPSRIARDGIDFTATSATAPETAADKHPGPAAPKRVAKKKTPELSK
jgi:hypothetical protein